MSRWSLRLGWRLRMSVRTLSGLAAYAHDARIKRQEDGIHRERKRHIEKCNNHSNPAEHHIIQVSVFLAPHTLYVRFRACVNVSGRCLSDKSLPAVLRDARAASQHEHQQAE